MNYSRPTRKSIIKALRGRISKVCVVQRDKRWVVQGKFCILEPFDDGTWDLWICNPNDMCAGLPQRTVNYRVHKLEKLPQNRDFTVLKGEAHTYLPGLIELISDPYLLRLLGFRRKKQLSDTDRKELVQRFSGRQRRKAA